MQLVGHSESASMERVRADYSANHERVRRVTLFEYPFNAVEKRDGIPLVFKSEAEELWLLVTQYSEDLRNPFTQSRPPNFGEYTAETVAAYDEELRLACKYFELMDDIDTYDEALMKGSFPLPGDRDEMLDRSESIFVQWEIAKQMAMQLEFAWNLFRKDRLARLERALEMHIANDRLRLSDTEPVHTWWPSGEFVDVLRREIAYMKRDLVLSDWYRVQVSMVHVTERPVFRLDEVSPMGEVVADDLDGRIAGMLELVGAA